MWILNERKYFTNDFRIQTMKEKIYKWIKNSFESLCWLSSK